MGTFRLPHFSAPHTLPAIDRDRLLAFLEPHRDYFRRRGVALPECGAAVPVPHDKLVGVFMTPDDETRTDSSTRCTTSMPCPLPRACKRC